MIRRLVHTSLSASLYLLLAAAAFGQDTGAPPTAVEPATDTYWGV